VVLFECLVKSQSQIVGCNCHYNNAWDAGDPAESEDKKEK